MKLKQMIKMYPSIFIMILAMLLISVANFFLIDNWRIVLIEVAVVIVFAVLMIILANNRIKATKKTVVALNDSLSADEAGNLRKFPLPIIIFDETEKVMWYNFRFAREVLNGAEIDSDAMEKFTDGRTISRLYDNLVFDAKIGGKEYTVYTSEISHNQKSAFALYYVENTALKTVSRKYEMSKPVVSLIVIDALEEIYRTYRESECAEIVASVERMTEHWFSSYSGIYRKLGNGRFISIVPNSDFDKMIVNKFDILEKVRAYTYNEKPVGLTLSIGCGKGENLSEAENAANQALDMALGRGGDQMALKNTDESYTFVGGVSTGIERRNKVRSRVMASAIGEAIITADNVLIMGHKFSDLDALGAALGMIKICQDLHKEARIVITQKTSLATPLINELKEQNMDGVLVLPEYAEHLITDKTLLIVVDTLRAGFLDSKKVYDKAKHVVVIDHHRKTVDYIDNAVIFYHEPKASSASEMVAELMQYTQGVRTTPVVANALLAGIMLDTKDFVLRTSTRTFEAAAYLRSKGADTVKVKRFFNNSLENQKLRGQIVLSAYEYKNCAIAVADIKSKDIRLISAQAADELLTINSVDASFVLFNCGDGTINISARSLGNINVQVIMEQFGGGGHQTMAACQLESSDMEDVKAQLQEKIDEYILENTKDTNGGK